MGSRDVQGRAVLANLPNRTNGMPGWEHKNSITNGGAFLMAA